MAYYLIFTRFNIEFVVPLNSIVAGSASYLSPFNLFGPSTEHNLNF